MTAGKAWLYSEDIKVNMNNLENEFKNLVDTMRQGLTVKLNAGEITHVEFTKLHEMIDTKLSPSKKVEPIPEPDPLVMEQVHDTYYDDDDDYWYPDVEYNQY